MSDNTRETLEKRAQRAILQKAIFRWESAVVISLTLLLTLFGQDLIPMIPWWAYLAGGLAAEAGLIYSSLTDPKTGQEAVAQMLRTEFRPQRLRNARLQQQMEQALAYRSRITALIREREESILKDELTDMAADFDEWIEETYGLAERLDRYLLERETLYNSRDRATQRIKQLQAKRRHETDNAVLADIDTNIAAMQRQIDTIESLDNTMDRAQLRLENTLTAMGTIHPQVLLMGAKDIDSSRYRRLQHEIAEEVHGLEDVLVAMDDVYAANSAGATDIG